MNLSHSENIQLSMTQSRKDGSHTILIITEDVASSYPPPPPPPPHAEFWQRKTGFSDS